MLDQPQSQTPKGALINRILRKMKQFGENDALFKHPSDMTMEDVMNRMSERTKEPNSAKKQAMMVQEQKIFEQIYGNDPVTYDETGKMVQPKPKWISLQNKKPTCPNGKPLDQSVRSLVDSLPRAMSDDQNESHLKRAVRGFQAGVNLLSPKSEKMSLPLLKEDGVFGPKTAQRLKRNLLTQGAGKTAETIAIGQMKDVLQKVRQNGLPEIGPKLRNIFEPLLPASYSHVGGFQLEGLALQDTINDLSPEHVDPLKDDGIVGPKTNGAFTQTVKAQDDDTILKRFAHNIGFIDLD